MKSYVRQKSWSPYIVGMLIGILSWFTFLTANEPIGITTAFENTAAVAIEGVSPSTVTQNSYFTKPGGDPRINWEWLFVIGVFGGAFISARLSNDKTKESIPKLWQKRFGTSVPLRYIAAFGGGALMMFGARLAQGCTSGHMISGTLQLAVASWIFAVTVFLFGIVFSRTIYGEKIEEVYGKPI